MAKVLLDQPRSLTADVGRFSAKNSSKMLNIFNICLRFSRHFSQKIGSASTVLPAVEHALIYDVLPQLQKSSGKSQFNLNNACFLMTIQHLLSPTNKLGNRQKQNRYANLPNVELNLSGTIA